MRRIAVLVGMAGIALAGCGDDDTLSEEEFLEQGNEICSEGGEALDAAFEEAFGDEEPTPDQIADFADEVEDNISGQIDDLADLNPPDDLADDVDEVLDEARDVLDDFVQTLRDDPESAFATEEDPFADLNSRLEELGLSECAD